ncbi:Monocarboxylate transporter 9 [Nymphon striatum]|nr:Monocarboxylate transporter 9 [Nymphon striatum]
MINNPRYSLRQDGRHSHVTFIATVCLGAKELGRYGFGRVNSIMDDSNTSKASTRQGKAVDPRHELDGKYSWVVAVCCLLHYFVTFGIIKSSGVISVRLYQTFNMTRSQAVTIPIVMFGSEFTAGIICSSILKCLGFRRTIFGAITSVFIGLFSSSFVRTPGLLCLTMGVIVGLGLGTINVTMISIPSRFFKANLGKATGFAITGSGIGGFVFPPLIKYIEDIYGLSGTFLLLSGVVLHLYVFASLIIEPPDRHLAPNPGHETDNEANQEVQATFEMDENVSCKSKSENLSIISDNKLQKLDDEKCEGFLNKALEIDEVQVPRDSANNHTLSESGLPSAAISNTQENTSKVKSEDRTMWSRMKCCCAMPFHKKSLKNFFKENLSVMRNKYCIAIGFSYLPLKLSLSLSSITFPDIAVGLGFSLTQGAMLISIIASMDILSRVVNGFFLDTKLKLDKETILYMLNFHGVSAEKCLDLMIENELNVEQRSVAGVCLQMDAAECRVEQGDLLWRPSIWEECRKLLAGTETQIAELASNQEEADDRIMFHINDGAVKHGVQSVLVDSPDTDVFVNLIFHFNKSWQLQKLYVKLGNRKTKKTVPVYLLVDQLDNGLVSCLPAIHMLSVVATVPARWVQSCLAWKTSMDLSLLEGFGVEELSPEITNNAEKFLVSGLKKTDCSTFD